MPAFSSSINKSGLNKRLAPKAPPRRRIRNVTTPNTGSRSEDIASRSQSFTATPDPQLGQDPVASDPPAPQEQIHDKHGAGSGTRTNGDSAKGVLSENPVEPSAIPIPTPASSRSPRAPTIISTEPQKRLSALHAGTQASPETAAENAKTAEPAQTSRQTRTSMRALRGKSRTDYKASRVPDPDDEVGLASRVPNRPRKPAKELQSAATKGPDVVATHGGKPDRALEQDCSRLSNVQTSAKTNARSKARNSFANDEVLAQPQTDEDYGLQPANPASTRSRSTRIRKQRLSAQEAADEVICEATSGTNKNRGQANERKRKRKLSSAEAENHEIVPAEVKMADLIKDKGLGKTSKRESEMQKIDWAEVKKKRREAEEEALKEERRQKECRKNGRPLPPPGPHVAERLVLVNGQMVIDESSRVIDRNAETARDADQLGEAIDEDHLTKRVNQSTVGRKLGATRSYSIWDDEQTEQFYQGLRMFGTDFMMISKMFPGTSRAIVKKKYTKEEKLNPEKIFTALNSKEPVDLQAFSEMTDTVYDDPKDFYKELLEEQTRLEAEDAKMRAEEAEVDQEIQESIEQRDEVEGTDGEPLEEGEPPVRKNRYAAEAQRIIDGTAASKKKTKKTPSAKKKEGKKGRGLPAEGTEEMVGRIEDVAP